MENGKLNEINRGYVYVPTDGADDKPVILFAHGSGEAGNPGQESKMLTQGLPAVIKNKIADGSIANSQINQFVVVFTQSVVNSDMAPKLTDLLSALYNLNLNIDRDRIYATGLSAGGNTIADGFSTSASKVAAVVPMSSKLYVGNLTGYKYGYCYYFCGDSDTGPLSNSKTMVDKINAAYPGHARLYIYSGGHCCWPTYYNDSFKDCDLNNGNKGSIYDWLLQYTLAEQQIPDAPVQPKAMINIESQSSEEVILTSENSIGTIDVRSWGIQAGGAKGKTLYNGLRYSVYNMIPGAANQVYVTVQSNSVGFPSSAKLTFTTPAPVANAEPDPVESEPEQPANPPADLSDDAPQDSPVRILRIIATMSDGTEAELFNATK